MPTEATEVVQYWLRIASRYIQAYILDYILVLFVLYHAIKINVHVSVTQMYGEREISFPFLIISVRDIHSCNSYVLTLA